MNESALTRCTECGAAFDCAPERACWCKSLPALHKVPTDAAGCYCPACLRRVNDSAKATDLSGGAIPVTT